MKRRRGRVQEEREDEKRRIADSLAFYDALALAMKRSHEILSVTETAAGPDEAVEGVRRLLGVSEAQAVEVLNTQLRRFTLRDRAWIAQERDRLRALVDATPDSGA